MTDDDWHELWTHFHKHQTDTIRVPNKLLAVLDPKLIVEGRRKSSTSVIPRKVLWDALQEEGKR